MVVGGDVVDVVVELLVVVGTVLEVVEVLVLVEVELVVEVLVELVVVVVGLGVLGTQATSTNNKPTNSFFIETPEIVSYNQR